MAQGRRDVDLRQELAEKVFELSRQGIPSGARIYVLPVEYKGQELSAGDVSFADSGLRERLAGLFTLVERTSDAEIAAELRRQADGLTDPTKAIAVGKQVGASILLRATINERRIPGGDAGRIEEAIAVKVVDLEAASQRPFTRLALYDRSVQVATPWGWYGSGAAFLLAGAGLIGYGDLVVKPKADKAYLEYKSATTVDSVTKWRSESEALEYRRGVFQALAGGSACVGVALVGYGWLRTQTVSAGGPGAVHYLPVVSLDERLTPTLAFRWDF